MKKVYKRNNVMKDRVMEIHYNDNGDIVYERLHHYHGRGKMISPMIPPIEEKFNEYDDKGRRISSMSYNSSTGKLLSENKWHYDKNGNVIYNMNRYGHRRDTTERRYDDNNNEIQYYYTSSITSLDGKSLVEETFEEKRTYDNQDRLIKKTVDNIIFDMSSGADEDGNYPVTHEYSIEEHIYDDEKGMYTIRTRRFDSDSVLSYEKYPDKFVEAGHVSECSTETVFCDETIDYEKRKRELRELRELYNEHQSNKSK